MGGYLKQSTAAHIMFGPFVDKTNGVDLEVAAGIVTSIDHATTGIFLSKNGGAGAIRHQNVTASVLDAYGMFQVHLDTTDTDTVGNLRVMMAEAATFLPVHDDFIVLPANVYDSLMGTDNLDVQVKAIDADAITAASINTGALTADAFAADAIIAATLATGVLTADAFAADAIVAATLATGAITADAFAANAIIAATFAAGAIDAAAIANGAIDNATFAADVGSTAYATNIIGLAADKAVANAALATAAELLKVPKSDSNVTWNATALGSIQTEANDALIANNLDHLALTATAAADMTTEVADNTILARVLGNGDTSTFVPSTDGLHAAGVDIDAILADTNELQVDDYPTSIAAVKADTAAILTDTGTTLEADLDAIIAAVITNAAGVDIAADIIALKAETASILADTNELQVDDYPTSIAAVKADTAAILTDTGTTLDGRIPAALVGGKMDVAHAIPKNTALAKFAFVMTDSTTHAPKAGVTVTCTRSIDGAAFGAGTLANVAEQADAVGGYLVDFGAGDLNGKVIMLRATGAGCDDTFVTLVTEV